MADRYEKIQDVGANLWTKGCPVVIYKGALLKDNTVGKNLLQLGFENIQNESIAGIEINFIGYSMGQEKIIENSFSYLDLNMLQNDKVGEKQPIYLDNSNVRIFDFIITRVFYKNGHTWESDKTLKSVDEQKPIKNFLGGELSSEFWRVYGCLGKKAQRIYAYLGKREVLYEPMQGDSFWRCACSAINVGKICRICNTDKDWLFEIYDADYLSKSRNDYIESEKEKQYERGKLEQQKGTEVSLKNAIRIFASLSGWKDSDAAKAECIRQLEEINNANEKKKKKTKKIASIIGIIAVVLMAIGIVCLNMIV